MVKRISKAPRTPCKTARPRARRRTPSSDAPASRDRPRPLAGRVAVVAGATRGAGRGIARALGEAGATSTARAAAFAASRRPTAGPRRSTRPPSSIAAAGGTAIAVRVDHTVEARGRRRCSRDIDREHGRVDVVVNSIAGEDPMMGQWG